MNRYQLIDFGHGRKLESLAGRLIDRPSPAAENHLPRNAERWPEAESRFDPLSRTWQHATPWPDDLSIEAFPSVIVPVQPTPFGHIGVFPEQLDNWRWLQKTSPPESTSARSAMSRALNLFAYTGVSTMSLATAGMQVAHVDAAKPNVEAAKRVAVASGLGDAKIRYLVDDVVDFVRRETRRGNRYHTIVMDPPAYGHGPKSRRSRGKTSTNRPERQAKSWRIRRDLPELLLDCLELISQKSFRLLITGHSAEMDQSDVIDFLQRKLSHRRLGRLDPQFESGRMTLTDESGRHLDAGFYVRCWRCWRR